MSSCVAWNAAFSLGGNAIGFGAVAAYDRLLPRLIPGARGQVTGGDSQVLGRNMLAEMGQPNASTWRPYEAQHVLPVQASGRRIVRRIGIDLDDASNGMFLRRPARGSSVDISVRSRHRGFHKIYNDAALEAIDEISLGLPAYMAERRLFALQQKLRYLQDQGTPLYVHRRSGGGGSLELWRRLLAK